MSRACTSYGAETWTRTISYLTLAFICYSLPSVVFAASTSAGSSNLLRIQGSNTVGAQLAPALAKGLFEEQGFGSIRIESGAADNEQIVRARSQDGREVSITVAAHGSGTGFSALSTGNAELAASSRPIKDSEAQTLSHLGDMRSYTAEHIVALDGLAIILHPHNPLNSLSTAELAKVFAGEITDWAQLGAPAGGIHLYARDDNSGTFDTFNELILSAHGKTLSSHAKRFESSNALSDGVSQDINAIGFIGLPYIRQAKAVAVSSGSAQAMLPSQSQIATEDYPLSRRLFLYQIPEQENPWAQAFVAFSQSPRGQAIVEQTGFIPQTIQIVSTDLSPEMPENYQELVKNAKRLSVNFRFQEGSAALDNKARRDLLRLSEFLKASATPAEKLVLVGFGDPKTDPQRAELLSKLRAMAVRRELQRIGVKVGNFMGAGDDLPVASNQAEDGRLKNRRVEVWVY